MNQKLENLLRSPRHTALRSAAQVAILTLLVTLLPAGALTAQEAPAASAAPADGPRATVAQPVVDAGTVSRGQTIEVDFTIRNEGTTPLEITRVRPTCGCTVADYDKTIAPGGTGKVHATIDTTSIAGPNAKSITVYTNDPANPRLQLTAKSNVKLFIYADPGYARFSSFVRNDRDQTSSQLLWSPEFADLEVVDIETSSPFVRTRLTEVTGADRHPEGQGKQWRLDITLGEDTPIGPIAERVIVKLNHPQQTAMDIAVSGFVRPMVAVTPPNLNFGEVDPSDPQRWGVLVRNFGSDALEIGQVTTDIEGLRIEIEPLEEGKRYRVIFTPSTAMTTGAFRGQATIPTNLSDDDLTVELVGSVASR